MPYHLLKQGDAIQQDDECLDDNCLDWHKVDRWVVGSFHDPAFHTPMRRYEPTFPINPK